MVAWCIMAERHGIAKPHALWSGCGGEKKGVGVLTALH